MVNLWDRFMTGLAAFRAGFLSAGDDGGIEYGSIDARRLRYQVLWSYFENTAYADLHTWSTKLKADYALYAYVRNIYNPSYRLGEFHVSHLHGGTLDRDAGPTGALPIETDNPRLPPAIATLWQVSNWQLNKDVWTRNGSILGDTGVEVVDDTVRQKVYLRVVHPSSITSLTMDDFGNIKAYVRQEQRLDPRSTDSARRRMVTYTEQVTRGAGQTVQYAWFLDNTPYAWDDRGTTWDVPYGFVPLVMTQHINVGQDWGWSELHAGLPKVREADDLASELHDQIRKLVDSPWLLSGVSAPRSGTGPTTQGQAVTTGRPQPGREEIPIIYGPAGAAATPLVAPLDIAHVSSTIGDVLKELERDYPELQMDIWTAGGDTSGRALRTARQRTETKMQQRRVSYDDSIVRVQQMAVAIGGFRGYKGYEGFDLNSFGHGALDHRIAERPVFAEDALDTLETDTAFWTAAKAADAVGGIVDFLTEHGWDDARIAKLVQKMPAPAPVVPPVVPVPVAEGA